MCFDTMAQVVEYVTGDRITDPAALRGNRAALETVINTHNRRVQALHASPLAASATTTLATASGSASTADSPILGALWADKNYKGKDAVLYAGDGSGCYGATYGFPHAKDFGMNDNITSLASYSGCATTIYKDADYKGWSHTYQVASPNLPKGQDDETSSIVFRPRS